MSGVQLRPRRGEHVTQPVRRGRRDQYGETGSAAERSARDSTIRRPEIGRGKPDYAVTMRVRTTPTLAAVTALTKALFVLIAVSLTFLSAAVVTKLTVLYGARFQQALPITKPHAEHRQGHRDHDGDSDCVERTRTVDHADADGTRRRRTGCRAGCREGEGCLWTENGRYGNPRDGPNVSYRPRSRKGRSARKSRIRRTRPM